jgi:RNA polymerase sigma-70 factor (ECF subfamily)
MLTVDESALSDLIRDEWPKLRRFFRTKVPDSDVLNLARSTLLAFVDARARIAICEGAELWRTARRQVLEYYAQHRSAVSFDSTVQTILELDPSLTSRLYRGSRMINALHALPLDHQIAFELLHGEGLATADVAAALDVNDATTNCYLASAQATLTARLGEDSDAIRQAYAML